MAFKIGKNTKISVGIPTGNTVTWTPIVGAFELSLPEPEIEEVETTHFGSAVREFIAGYKDLGEMSFTLNHDPDTATDNILRSAFASGQTHALKVEIAGSNTDVEKYLGYCKGYTTAVPMDDRITKTATFRITGTHTLT